MQKIKKAGTFTAGILLTLFLVAFGRIKQQEGYIVEHEKQLAKEEPGTHKGTGMTTGYSFFSNVNDMKLVFRKRIMHPGSSIGYHLQETDEIYYILSGNGEMNMNGKTFPVTAGDAVLTRPGNSHGLKVTGKQDMTIIISYNK
ncbi:MAG: cupin domain-containing protein [Candidatus Dadabacteria bacterium]